MIEWRSKKFGVERSSSFEWGLRDRGGRPVESIGINTRRGSGNTRTWERIKTHWGLNQRSNMRQSLRVLWRNEVCSEQVIAGVAA